MKRLERPLRRALFAACSCAIALLTASSIALAADDIPRPPGAIDNRGYELVNLPDKDQNPVQLKPSAPTTDGNRIVYAVEGPTPDATIGALPHYTATRTAHGWVSRYLLPPSADRAGASYYMSAVTPDLTRIFATAFVGIGNSVGSQDTSIVTLDGNGGGQTLMHTFPVAFATSGVNAVASSDFRHIYVLVSADADPMLPDVVPGADLVYDFGGATPQLVSRMPGTDLAPLCGTPEGEQSFANFPYTQAQHWASTDGRRVFFASRGDSCGDPIQLYMRDVSAGTTTQISASALGPDNGIRRFLQATPNGSQVFYSTATSYDPTDSNDGDDSDMDVYRWSTATGVNLCVTCGVPNANVVDQNNNRTVAISEDGTHVYFSSTAQLADAPGTASTNQPNTYMWRLGSPSIRWLFRGNGVISYPQRNGYVTPNGHVLLFASNQPGLDSLTASSNGGQTQYYRYDDRDSSITCISCPTDGVATGSVPTTLALGAGAVMVPVRPASDDGSIVFFSTTTPLVPEDVNNGQDLYEWHDGVVRLISNGTTNYPFLAGPTLVSTTPDGHDAFFLDQARLTADAQDDASKLYDARIDGGFEPAPTPPEPCHGDCRGPPTAPPTLPDAGSGQPDGGNATGGKPGSFTIAKLGAKQQAAFARRGTIALRVRVSAAGRLEAFATARVGRHPQMVATAAVRARRAGSVTLHLRLSRAARRQLARSGQLRVAVTAAFATAPDSRRLVLTLKATRGGGATRAASQAAVRSTADGR